MAAPVLTMTPQGLYCPAGGFHIDPWGRVDRALITHGHSDHARGGHGRYLATAFAAPAIRHRLGRIAIETIGFGETRRIGAASVSFHPAGHLPGSAQIRVEVAGQVWVVSGDYKTEPDGLAEAFEPVSCHVFITECTFGLPVYRWQPQAVVAAEINAWWAACNALGVTPVLGAYSLGKAQRLLSLLDASIGPILCHPATQSMNAVFRAQGLALPQTHALTPELDPQALPGAILLSPARDSDWLRRRGPHQTAFASGWMQVARLRRSRGGGKGFTISDHADWDGLNAAIRATGAERVLVTHGSTGPFRRWLAEQGYDAAELKTAFSGRDDDDDDGADTAEMPE